MSRIAQTAAIVATFACILLPPATAAAKTPSLVKPVPANAQAKMVSAKSAAEAAPVLLALLPRLDFHPDMLYATGEGAMPSPKEQPNRAKAYLQAKAYAKMQAIASIVQEVKGTMISYCSTGHGFIGDAQIKQEIKGVLDCVRVVATKKRPEGNDTIVEVTVRAPKPALPKLLPPPEKKEPARSVPSWATPLSPPFPRGEGAGAAKDGGFTSLVIDAQGLGVWKSMSPKIVRPDGSEVWGTLRVDPDFLAEYGICAYARSRSEAFANRRAGENPLVVRAKARGPSMTRSDVVISNSDAETLLSEDRRSGFLGEFRVIMIVDR